MILSEAAWITFKVYILLVYAFPGNPSHDLSVASTMLYSLIYRLNVLLKKIKPHYNTWKQSDYGNSEFR